MLNSDTKTQQTKLKNKFLQENYKLLCKVFGKPPIKFDFNYQDINKNNVQLDNVTPIKFLENCLNKNLDDFIFVMNDNYFDNYAIMFGIDKKYIK